MVSHAHTVVDPQVRRWPPSGCWCTNVRDLWHRGTNWNHFWCDLSLTCNGLSEITTLKASTARSQPAGLAEMRQSVQMQWWSNLQSCCDSFSQAHSQGQYRCTRPSQEELLYRYFLYFNINPRLRSSVDYLGEKIVINVINPWKLAPLFLILWKNWCISSNFPWFLQFDSQPSLATQRWHKEQCFERAGLTRSQDRQCAMWKICSSHCAVWSSQGNRNSKSFTARRKGSGWWFHYMEKWKPCSKPPTRVLSSNHVVFLFAFHTFVHPFFLILSSKFGQNSRLPLVADLLHIPIRDGARIRLRRTWSGQIRSTGMGSVSVAKVIPKKMACALLDSLFLVRFLIKAPGI